MKINQKNLGIPPYVSTAWKNVVSLHIEEQEGKILLIIGLVNGSKIEIPHLKQDEIVEVFSAHEKYLEQEISNKTPQKETPPSPFPPGFGESNSALISLPLRFGVDSSMGNLMQHNPEAANSPDLPEEMLEKISALSQMIGFENGENLPKPEPHCNCPHCQIMRVMHDDSEAPFSDQAEEEDENEE